MSSTTNDLTAVSPSASTVNPVHVIVATVKSPKAESILPFTVKLFPIFTSFGKPICNVLPETVVSISLPVPKIDSVSPRFTAFVEPLSASKSINGNCNLLFAIVPLDICTFMFSLGCYTILEFAWFSVAEPGSAWLSLAQRGSASLSVAQHFLRLL